MSQTASAQRILPDLQSALLCEDVRQEANGKFIVIGVLTVLPVPQLPLTASGLKLFTRWTRGVGEFVETTKLIATDETTVLAETKVKFGVQDPAQCCNNLSVFNQVEFKQPGVYFIEVLVDDVLKLRFPVPVVVVQQQQPGQAPPAPPTEGEAPAAE